MSTINELTKKLKRNKKWTCLWTIGPCASTKEIEETLGARGVRIVQRAGKEQKVTLLTGFGSYLDRTQVKRQTL